jgi:hypothetical protein
MHDIPALLRDVRFTPQNRHSVPRYARLAISLKADIHRRNRDVRFASQADIERLGYT